MVSNIGSIVHAIPGRIRLRISRPYRTLEFFAQVRDVLTALPGVSQLEINEITGSVLIHYDPDTLDIGQLLKLGSELGWTSGWDGGAAFRNSLPDWRSQVNVTKVAQTAALLAAAVVGANAAPLLGLSGRFGSLSAAAAFVFISKRGRRVYLRAKRLGIPTIAHKAE